jgi:L-fuconolactonase
MNWPEYIIDSHVHFWNPQRLNYPWLTGVPTLNHVFVPEDYAVATEAANVGKMIFVECGCDATQSRDEVEWVCRHHPPAPLHRGLPPHRQPFRKKLPHHRLRKFGKPQRHQ